MPQSLRKQVGSRVKYLMLQNRMNQEDLALLTGLSKPYINQILIGMAN